MTYTGTTTQPESWIVYSDRDESEACEASTPGCSIDHTLSAPDTDCEGW